VSRFLVAGLDLGPQLVPHRRNLIPDLVAKVHQLQFEVGESGRKALQGFNTTLQAIYPTKKGLRHD